MSRLKQVMAALILYALLCWCLSPAEAFGYANLEPEVYREIEWFKYLWCLPAAITVWFAVVAFVKYVNRAGGGHE